MLMYHYVLCKSEIFIHHIYFISFNHRKKCHHINKRIIWMKGFSEDLRLKTCSHRLLYISYPKKTNININGVTSMFINKGKGLVCWFAWMNHYTVQWLFATAWNVVGDSKAQALMNEPWCAHVHKEQQKVPWCVPTLPGIDVTSHPIYIFL